MIGVFGGTFDPVHNGHLRIALELSQNLPFDSLHLIPSRQPPHREQPQASAKQRLKMLTLAINNEDNLRLDDRELQRDGPSYMVDTLTSLRAEYPQTPLCLIMGMDAFKGLKTWWHWEEILTLSHILVVHRPGSTLSRTDHQHDEMIAIQDQHAIDDPAKLNQSLAGHIAFYPATQLEIASSEIRRLCQAGKSVRYLLPDNVYQYIQQEQLYQ